MPTMYLDDELICNFVESVCSHVKDYVSYVDADDFYCYTEDFSVKSDKLYITLSDDEYTVTESICLSSVNSQNVGKLAEQFAMSLYESYVLDMLDITSDWCQR